MSDKERAQLLDLCEDWGKHLVTDVWEWNKGAAPPFDTHGRVCYLGSGLA